MFKFILIIIGLYVIISKPFLILIGGAAYLTWLSLKKPNRFARLPSHLTMPPGELKIEQEDDLSQEKKEYPTAEEVYSKEVKAKLKPGYKDDPKWQELTKKVRKHNAYLDEVARQEDRLRKLTDEVM